MPAYDLVCRECKHPFSVSQPGAIKAKQKRCPVCRSKVVRQTFGSYLRNGSLAAQGCKPRSGFG
jgi:putative FmdB family regulatory protein